MQTTLAIVLRRKPITESSLLVDWLTLDHGKLRTVARGAYRQSGRRTQTAFAPDLFQLCEVRVAPSKTSDLHSLAECQLCNAFPGISSDYQRTLCAAYFTSLAARALPEESPAPGVFDLLRRALEYLSVKPPTARAVLHFERELIAALDLEPDPKLGTLATLANHCGAIPMQRNKLECLSGSSTKAHPAYPPASSAPSGGSGLEIV